MKKSRLMSWFFQVRGALAIPALLVNFSLLGQSTDTYSEIGGNIGFEYRGFLQEGLYENQKQNFYSLSIQPEYLFEWKDGQYAFNFTGFARVDFNDEKRNHWDVRELYVQTAQGNWDASLGLKKIYWGVTEAVHLVDIVNQTDNLETFDGEQKLGQLMAHVSYMTNFGTFDVIAMTWFRKRQFPGINGRLRTPIPIEDGQIGFESDMKEWRPEVAVRWSHYLGPVDFGLSHFYGTGREPIVTGLDDNGQILGAYAIINQTGLDVQATTGPILWKLESIIRKSSIQDLWALDAGIEYTFGNIGGSGLDLGLIGEYLYDDRGDLALSSLQSDVFVGGRLAFNDVQSTELLFGAILDTERSTKLYSVEGSRRFGESLTASLEVRLFSDVAENEFVYLFRDDDFVKAELSWFF